MTVGRNSRPAMYTPLFTEDPPAQATQIPDSILAGAGPGENLLRTLLATGATLLDACEQLWDSGLPAFREKAIRYGAAEFARLAKHQGHELFKEWLLRNPAMANRMFLEIEELHVETILDIKDPDASGRLLHLPRRMKVDRPCVLAGCTRLVELPERFEAAAYLDLHGCTALRHLPKGLKVEGSLRMEGCTSWDGVIPEGAEIGQFIFTDEFPWNGGLGAPHPGLRLAEWRERFGSGPCFKVGP